MKQHAAFFQLASLFLGLYLLSLALGRGPDLKVTKGGIMVTIMPVKDAMPKPSAEETCEGMDWLRFSMETRDYSEYKTFPNALKYRGKTFRKTGWDSDSLTVFYKECDPDEIPTAKK